MRVDVEAVELELACVACCGEDESRRACSFLGAGDLWLDVDRVRQGPLRLLAVYLADVLRAGYGAARAFIGQSDSYASAPLTLRTHVRAVGYPSVTPTGGLTATAPLGRSWTRRLIQWAAQC
jgi:hypothetical protein